VANWDGDSPRLRANLAQVVETIVRTAGQGETSTVEAARRWQSIALRGLDLPDSRSVGAFRGEPGLENIQVRVGASWGVGSRDVAAKLARFEQKLQMPVAELHALLPVGQEPSPDQLAAIIDLCACVHAEWLRIYPFANGNGRTARLWANILAMRYGLPPFIRLRPRPDTRYIEAGAKAMRGEWKPTALVFRQLLDDFLNRI